MRGAASAPREDGCRASQPEEYRVIKTTWRGAYSRVLRMRDGVISTFDPTSLHTCTNQWPLHHLLDVNGRIDERNLRLRFDMPGQLCCVPSVLCLTMQSTEDFRALLLSLQLAAASGGSTPTESETTMDIRHAVALAAAPVAVAIKPVAGAEPTVVRAANLHPSDDPDIGPLVSLGDNPVSSLLPPTSLPRPFRAARTLPLLDIPPPPGSPIESLASTSDSSGCELYCLSPRSEISVKGGTMYVPPEDGEISVKGGTMYVPPEAAGCSTAPNDGPPTDPSVALTDPTDPCSDSPSVPSANATGPIRADRDYGFDAWHERRVTERQREVEAAGASSAASSARQKWLRRQSAGDTPSVHSEAGSDGGGAGLGVIPLSALSAARNLWDARADGS